MAAVVTISDADDTDRGLSPITGEFLDKRTEARFRLEQFPETVTQARFLFILGAIVYTLFFLVGLALNPELGTLQALIPRIPPIVAALFCLLLLPRAGARGVDVLLILWQGSATAGSAALLSVQANVSTASIFLVPAILVLTSPASFTKRIGVGAGSSVVMWAAMYASRDYDPNVVKIAIALVLLNGLLWAMTSRNGRLLRRQWSLGQSYREALHELAESRALLERTFAAVPVPLIVTTIEDGTIVRMNEAGRNFLRLGDADPTGRKMTEFYIDSTRRPRFVTALQETGSVRNWPSTTLAADGSLHPVAVSAAVFTGSGGGVRRIISCTIDQTERLQRERELKTAEKEYRLLFENSIVGISRSTLDGKMLRANPALVKLNGYESEGELIAAVNDIASEWYVEPGRRDEWKALMLAEDRVVDFVSEIYRHKTRERIWISESGWTVRDEAGRPLYFETTVTEANERMQLANRHKYLAHYDDLTDLPNRRMLSERLSGASKSARENGSHFAVMCLDLDRFKAVNDAFGHAIGDKLLQEAARRLKLACRDNDLVARIGGDEFTILFCGLAGPRQAAMLAQRTIDLFREPFDLGSHRAFVGTSIGIAFAPGDGLEPDELLKKADQALYLAKSRGRNQYRFFNSEFESSAGEAEPDWRTAVGQS